MLAFRPVIRFRKSGFPVVHLPRLPSPTSKTGTLSEKLRTRVDSSDFLASFQFFGQVQNVTQFLDFTDVNRPSDGAFSGSAMQARGRRAGVG
jgi:hypothetical protein